MILLCFFVASGVPGRYHTINGRHFQTGFEIFACITVFRGGKILRTGMCDIYIAGCSFEKSKNFIFAVFSVLR